MRSTVPLRFIFLPVLIAFGCLRGQAQVVGWEITSASSVEGTIAILNITRSPSSAVDTVWVGILSGDPNRITSFTNAVIFQSNDTLRPCQVQTAPDNLCNGDTVVVFRLDSTTAGSISFLDRNDSLTVVDDDDVQDSDLSGTNAICVGGFSDFNSLVGGGIWTSSNTSTAIIDPNTGAITGEGPGIATMTYTMSSTPSCADSTATRIVTVSAPPNPGTLTGTQQICVGDITVFSSSGDDGLWASSDPAIATIDQNDGEIIGVGGGIATMSYTVEGTGGCTDSTATRPITVIAPPDPGTDGSAALCDVGFEADLINYLGGTPDLGGFWLDPNGVLHSGTFTPGTSQPGEYTYIVQGDAPCPNDTSVVDASVAGAPEAGEDTTLTVCSSFQVFDMFPLLNGADTGGFWLDDNDIPHSSLFDPGADNTGSFRYILSATAPCESDTGWVNVTVNTMPNAGQSDTVDLCIYDLPYPLIDILGGADTTGIWIGQSTLGGGYLGIFAPGSNEAGLYTYTVAGILPCLDVVSTVQVSVVDSVLLPDVTSLDGTTFCLGQYTTIIVNDAQQGAGYVWDCEGCTVNFTTGETVELLWDTVPGNWSFSVFAQIGACASDTVVQFITLGSGSASCPKGIVFFEPHGLAILDPWADQFQWGRFNGSGDFVPTEDATNQTIFDPGNIAGCLPYYSVRTRQGNGCWTTTTTCVDNTPPHDCSTSGMAPGGDDLEVSVSPNPPQDDRIQVLLSGVVMDEPITVELITANGKVLHSQTYTARPQITIDTRPASLSPGLYLLRVQGSGGTKTSKVTIE